MNLNNKCTEKLCYFLVNDTTLASDNPLETIFSKEYKN